MLGNFIWGLSVNPHFDPTYSDLFPPWNLNADDVQDIVTDADYELAYQAWRDRCDSDTLTAHVIPVRAVGGLLWWDERGVLRKAGSRSGPHILSIVELRFIRKGHRAQQYQQSESVVKRPPHCHRAQGSSVNPFGYPSSQIFV